MKESRASILGVFIALAALIVAVLNYLAPFSPIGPSPFASDDTEQTSVEVILPTEPVATVAQVPTSEPSTAPTTESVTVTMLQAGDIRVVMRGGVAVEQVFVPAGSFMMGSESVFGNERPVHEVSLDAFWIDRTEVTNAQFSAFVADTGYETTAEREGGYSFYNYTDATMLRSKEIYWQHPRGPESNIAELEYHPVVQISWEDANAFCKYFGGRLPTEAEWEYAARGPESMAYPWGDSFDGERLNFCDRNCPFGYADMTVDDGMMFTAPVGTYPDGASWVGALDLVGNVSEWVNDWYVYGINYYERSPAENPTGPESGEFKVIRGDAFSSSYNEYYSSAHRDGQDPNRMGPATGFRCVQD